jgi:glutamine---fructose-6-phosphate transaminase (isomerizing)
MCGIVGAVSERNVANILLEGLKRLEYRGYDSAGLAIINEKHELKIAKSAGKVGQLVSIVDETPMPGHLGVAHTRWATHGVPNDTNAHPHRSGDICVVHNGIIENYKELRAELQQQGYKFNSETDTEVIVHLVHLNHQKCGSVLEALQLTIPRLHGAYGVAVMCGAEPNSLLVARSGSPLVIGLGIDENFIASDQLALRQVTDRFIYLEEGDIAQITTKHVHIYDKDLEPIDRKITTITESADAAEKGPYRHFMLKEIYEQPAAIKRTIEGRLSKTQALEEAFGVEAKAIFDQVDCVQIVACGTSYHSGMVTKYALEDWAGIPVYVDIASEFRYRKVIVPQNALFVTISQSGETADTLAALRLAKASGYLGSLAICNVANSSLVRESDLCLMTNAGPEIGVASTKAFTTQLVALQILGLVLGRRHGLTHEHEAKLVAALHELPRLCEQVLSLNPIIEQMSLAFVEKHHALFLGRGIQYPVAMEGALKLKEISYIHAEAYPAGELKHGPLALVDSDMPVVAVAPHNDLLEKLKSNLEEVQARGGKLFVFADHDAGFTEDANTTVINIPHVPDSLEPIIYTLPLQLLSYHVATLRGTDVDQPRNLAKSVTVE